MNETQPEQKPSTLSQARGNKKVRLILIAILILVAAYLLYSVW